uniref:Uncharacterized protein n=1 Tax=Stomoxys calcitrans TaxID=35570 RepID=A0A1I8PKC8_STOCA
MKLFLSATLAIMLGIMAQAPRTQAATSLKLGGSGGLFGGLGNLANNLINTGANIAGNIIDTGANVAGNMINTGANIMGGGINTATNILNGGWGTGGQINFDYGALLGQFGVFGGNGNVVLNWNSVLSQGPDAQGNFDLGLLLSQFGFTGNVAKGQLLIKWDSMLKVQPDAAGNISISHLLGQIFGGANGSTTIEWNSGAPQTQIVINWDMIKGVQPDASGNIDLGALLAQFGYNLGSGKYIISWSDWQKLQPNASGQIDFSSIIGQLNGAQSTITLNWQNILSNLGVGNDVTAINVNVNAFKSLKPSASGTVDVGPMLGSFGINIPSLVVNWDTIQNLPSDASGNMDLLALLKLLNVNVEGAPTTTESNITITWDMIKNAQPDANGNIDLGALLTQFGFNLGTGKYIISWNDFQKLSPDASGKIDFTTILGQLNGSTPTTTITFNWNDILHQLGVGSDVTAINVNINAFKNLKPSASGTVDIGPMLSSFGVNIPSLVVNWDTVQNLPSDASGNIDLLNLFKLLNINIEGAPTTVVPQGNIVITWDSIKGAQPDLNGNIDLGALLTQFGYNLAPGKYFITWNDFQKLIPDASGKIDFTTILGQLNPNGGNPSTPTEPTGPVYSMMVNLNDVYSKLNIPSGNKIILGVDTLKNLRPDNSGNVDIGSFLQHFGIPSGSFVVPHSLVQSLPSDASGKIDLLTLLKHFNIGFTYGGNGEPSQPISINLDDLYNRLGFTKGSTIKMSIDTLKSLTPDSFGNVDAGHFLQSLGIGNGSYLINYNVVQNLPTDAEGKIDLLTLFQKFNIDFNYGGQNQPTEPLVVNIDDIFSKLGFGPGSTVTIGIDNLKTIKPDGHGNVDISYFLQQLGINTGSYLINYDVIQNLPSDANGKINLLTLLERLGINFQYGNGTPTGPTEVFLDKIHEKFNIPKGNTITMSVDTLKNLHPDAQGNVDISAFLNNMGIPSGSYLVSYDTIQNLPTDVNGKIDLQTLLNQFNIKFYYGNGSPSENQPTISIQDIYTKFGIKEGSKINISAAPLKNLKPDSAGKVDVGNFLKPLGVPCDSHIVDFGLIQSLPTDPTGNIDLVTLLDNLNVVVTGREPTKLNLDDILNMLTQLSSINGGHSISIDINGIKNLVPNSNNEIDIGPLLQKLNLGNGGSYFINWDFIKNMPNNPTGSIDLLTFLNKLTSGNPVWEEAPKEPNNIDLNALFNQLNGGSTININLQGVWPNSNNEVDLGPLLLQLGIGNGGQFLVNFNTLKELQGPNGNINLTTLISKLPNFNGGGSTTIEWNTHPTQPSNIDISAIINKLVNQGSNTVTLNVEGLRPNGNNQVDIGPFLQQWGLPIGGTFNVDINFLKNMEGPSGTIDLSALLNFLQPQLTQHQTWNIPGETVWQIPEMNLPEKEIPGFEIPTGHVPTDVPVAEIPTIEIPQQPEETHWVPEQPEEPHWVPEQPEEPHWVPEQPEEPHWVPEQPEEPHWVPETPEEPHWVPEQPEEPHWVPETPEEPHWVPEQPEEPHWVPEQPEQPTWVPQQPEEPTWVPEQPEQPTWEPEQPEEPTWVPEQPEQPTWEPEQPIVQPEEPEQPTWEPENPEVPTWEEETPSVEPTPEEPTYPYPEEEPSWPFEPEEPNWPVEPEEPSTPELEPKPEEPFPVPEEQPFPQPFPEPWRPNWDITGRPGFYPQFFYQLPQHIREILIRFLHGYPGFDLSLRPDYRLIIELLHQLKYVPTFGRDPMTYDPLIANLMLQLYGRPSFDIDFTLHSYLIRQLYDMPSRNYLLRFLYDMPTYDLLTLYLHGSRNPWDFMGQPSPRDYLLRLLYGPSIPSYFWRNIYGNPIPGYPHHGRPHHGHPHHGHPHHGYPHGPHFPSHGFFPRPTHGHPGFPNSGRPGHFPISINGRPGTGFLPNFGKPSTFPSFPSGKPSYPGTGFLPSSGKPSTFPSFPSGLRPVGGHLIGNMQITVTHPGSPAVTIPANLPKLPTIQQFLNNFANNPSNGKGPVTTYPSITTLPNNFQFPGSGSPSSSGGAPSTQNFPGTGGLPNFGNFPSSPNPTMGNFFNSLKNHFGSGARPNFGSMFGNSLGLPPQPRAVNA